MTKYLGTEHRDPITAEGLDTVTVPDGVDEVVFTTDELTAFCPVTKQPDFYSVRISYAPRGRSLESKALKLYLAHFREEGVYAEALAHRIASDLSPAVGVPVEVRLEQQMRGGLVLTVRASDGGQA